MSDLGYRLVLMKAEISLAQRYSSEAAIRQVVMNAGALVDFALELLELTDGFDSLADTLDVDFPESSTAPESSLALRNCAADIRDLATRHILGTEDEKEMNNE